MVRGVGKPDWKSDFTLAHPQGTPTLEVSLAQKTSARLRRSHCGERRCTVIQGGRLHDSDSYRRTSVTWTDLASGTRHTTKPLTPRAIARCETSTPSEMQQCRRIDSWPRRYNRCDQDMLWRRESTPSTECSAQMLVSKPPPPLVPEVNGPCNPPMPPQPQHPVHTLRAAAKGCSLALCRSRRSRSQAQPIARLCTPNPTRHAARPARTQRACGSSATGRSSAAAAASLPSSAAWKLSVTVELLPRAPAVPIS